MKQSKLQIDKNNFFKKKPSQVKNLAIYGKDEKF